MKYHYTYLITNIVNGKKYIGDHSTNNLDDGYRGSGVLLKEDQKNIGVENFHREILEFFDTKEEAYHAQKKYIEKYKTHISQGGYNKNWTGGQWATEISNTTRKKLMESSTGEKNGMYGKKHSRKAREKQRKKAIGRPSGFTGRAHSNEAKAINREKHLGFIMPEEQKEKISNTLSGRIFSESHRKNLSESSKGRSLSLEHKKKLSKYRMGKSPSNKGKPMSEEQKQKMKDAWIKRRMKKYD